jgi:hypothetical protein
MSDLPKEEIGNGEFLKSKAITVDGFFDEGENQFQMEEVASKAITPEPVKEIAVIKDKGGDTPPEFGDKADAPKPEVKPEEDNEEKKTFFGDEPGEEVNADGFSVLPIIEVIHDKFGWDFDADAFKGADLSNVDTLTDYITNIIEENSKPEYANNISESFDQYLRNGGRPEQFLENYNSETDYTVIDLEDENNLRMLGVEYYTKTGQSVEEAEETVKDLEESNALAKLAPKFVKQLDSWQKSESAANEKARLDALKSDYEASEKALENTYNTIQSKDEIAGLPFKNKADKDKFFEFAYVPDKKGETAYQKMFKADPEMELKMLMFAYRGISKEKILAMSTDKATKDLRVNLEKFTDSQSKHTSSLNKDGKSKRLAPEDFNANDWIME